MAFQLVEVPELTFADAAELVARMNAAGSDIEQFMGCSEDALFAAYEAAEQKVLTTVPQSSDEAAEMITVVLAQGSERVDGLDQTALVSVRAFLRALPSPTADAQAVLTAGAA